MNTIKETKRISANLRPATLDDLGLMATIEWYIRQFKQLYGNIQLDYTADISEADIPEFMKIVLYRIIQEGLSNAEKHSEASTIHLDLRHENIDGERISLTIEDNGHGFDVDSVLSNKDPLSGYGLTAMVERCEIVGGTFNVASTQGRGTKITAVLPI
jgi:signal transduction histidine kinase